MGQLYTGNEGVLRLEARKMAPAHNCPTPGAVVSGAQNAWQVYCWPTGAGSALPPALFLTLLLPNEVSVPATPVILFITVVSASES